MLEVKRLKEDNERLRDSLLERDALLSQCEGKIRAYEGTAKE